MNCEKGWENMNYKKEIMNMVEKIQNEDYLKKIYDFVSVPYEKDKKERGEK